MYRIFMSCEQEPDICKIFSLCAISGIIIFNEEKYNRSSTKMAGHTWFEIVFYVVLVLIGVTIYRSYTYLHDIRIIFLQNNFHYNSRIVILFSYNDRISLYCMIFHQIQILIDSSGYS